MNRHIVVGSRQSALALTQTNQVIESLEQIAEEMGWTVQFSIKKIVTEGDRILDVTLSKVGGKGLFVKEIERELLDCGIDLAVHSMKDMPSSLPDGLVIGAVPKREDVRDVLISRDNIPLAQLPKGARVGTSSLRRACQLKAYRPDLQLESIRGNIDTRLKKLESGEFDAIVLAAAGLSRIGWSGRISEYIGTEICIPAVGQGALGIECRAADEEIINLLAKFNDPKTERTVTAERAFLARLNGGCQVPIGAHAELSDGNRFDSELILNGIVGTPEGDTMLKCILRGSDPVKLGEQAAEELIAQGADRILEQVRGE